MDWYDSFLLFVIRMFDDIAHKRNEHLIKEGIWWNCILFRFRFGIIDDSDYICTSIKFRVNEDMEAARMVE